MRVAAADCLAWTASLGCPCKRLEIRPGRALAVNFRMPEGKLVCGAGQHWLKVDDEGRPQAFVVEWKAGGTAHSVQVPCGTCQLQLVKKGK